METTSTQQQTKDESSFARRSGGSNTETTDQRRMTPSTATRNEPPSDESPAAASQASSPASSSSSSAASAALEKYSTPHGTSSEQSSEDEKNVKMHDEERPKGAAHQKSRNESSTAKTAVESTTKPVRKETTVKQPKQNTRNDLTHLVPGYVAPMRLETTPALDAVYRPVGGLEALRQQAIRSDPILSRAVPLHKIVATRSSRSRTTLPHPAVGFLATRNGAPVAAPNPMRTAATTIAPMTVFKTGISGSNHKSNKAKKGQPPNDAGNGWFNMRPTPLSQELKHDWQLIRNRNYLDPKRFYKSLDTSLSGAAFCQQGTVVEGPTEYYSSRLTKKQRGTNLVEEVLADASLSDYARNQYRKRQQEASAQALRRSSSSSSSSRNKKHKGSKRK